MAELTGLSGNDVTAGTGTNDVINSGAGSDTIDGGSGSDRLNAGSGNDTLIYTLGQNTGANDLYTGGSGIDTVRLVLTSAEWLSSTVQTQIHRYVDHLNTVKTNINTGEVSNGTASDFTFYFDNGTKLTVSMMEKLDVWVDGHSIDYHAPFVTTADDVGAVTEDAATPNLTDTGTINFTDVDWSQTHTASAAANADNTLGGTLTASVNNDSTGDGTGQVTWTYEVANSAVQYLADGETATEKFTVTIDDGQGGTVDQLVTVTITGTNDDPTITVVSTDDAGAVTEDDDDPTLSDTGTITFNDIDLIDEHTTSVVADGANTLGGTLTMGAVSEDAGTEPGTVGWTYEVANSAVQYLADGETATEKFTVTIDDGQGGTVDQLVTVTITGTNDAPVLTVDASGSVTEDATAPTLTDTGTLSFTDVDFTDTHTTSATPLSAPAWSDGDLSDVLTPAQITALTSGFTVDADSWDYTVANSLVQFLAEDETITFSYTVTVTDNSGEANDSDSETVTVTITGNNDAPVITSDGGGASASLSVAENTTAVADVDATDVDLPAQTLTYSILNTAGTDFAKFTINSSTGVLSFISAPDFENPQDVGGTAGDNAYVVDVEVSDGSLSDTQTITVNVQDVNAAPVITGGATASVNVDENTTAVTDVDATDDGENNNTLTYSLVSTAGTDFAKFTINTSTGVLSFLSAPDFENPQDVGGTDGDNSYVVEVQASDGSLSDTQTITVNVQNVNAAPVITSNGGGATASLNVNENTTAVTNVNATDDGENNNTVTYSLVNTAGTDFAKFTINSSSGVLSFISAPDFENPQDVGGANGDNSYEVDVQASDGSLTDTQTITVNVQDMVEVTPTVPVDVTVPADEDQDNDTLTGTDDGSSNQADVLVGNSSGNNIDGQGGNDTIYGGGGGDTLQGGTGDDVIYGQSGGDTINGGNQSDSIYGGSGNDSISGDENNDLVFGGSGDDTIDGGGGDDTLYGGSGNDSVVGSNSDDQIIGGFGVDTVTGGNGNDKFIFANGHSGLTAATADVINGFVSGTDRIDLGNAGTAAIFSDVGSVADFAAALAAANAAMNTAVIYAFADFGGNGYLFEDYNADGTADQVIKLAGVTSIVAGDLI